MPLKAPTLDESQSLAGSGRQNLLRFSVGHFPSFISLDFVSCCERLASAERAMVPQLKGEGFQVASRGSALRRQSPGAHLPERHGRG